ncbi:hypothetical protein K488DRAFT_57871 [Vararia minispora EC-137]|uniref:Uncharacterized protein n=1 Tax=Vararia minispora EC-137 TaxID=1314806 RepID=A0ACB8QAP1_9AGAM|nr:hypothetical protein K488DRAFT_57871 [Vararia minispora EC-137]
MTSAARLSPQKPAPTIDDLRVRLCYVCREEEEHGAPQPKRWVHPCSCTLIAHEACLLQWIKSAQESRDRSKNALKCPQCGARYQLESHNPPILRLLEALNRGISRAGTIVTVASLGGVVVTCAGGVYLLLASYGGVALKEYLGRRYFTFVLTDDPNSWSWATWLSLPLIPISLILSRLPLGTPSPTVPSTMLLLWSAVTPDEASSYFASHGILRYASIWPLTPAPLWPPSPTLICVCYPLVHSLYHAARRRLTHYVTEGRRSPLLLPPNVQRFLWAFGGDNGQHGARIDIMVQGDVEQPDVQQERDREQRLDGENNGEAAERTIRITGASLGRLLGGALVMPYIASAFGNALLGLSRRSHILRTILAVKESAPRTAYQWEMGFTPKDGGLVGAIERAARREGLPAPGIGGTLRILLRLLTFGHRAWIESDPVWWRNTLGLGLFIVLKDVIKVVHLWLAKQELESRHLKNRDFAGIDPKELDLVHPWPSVGSNISVAPRS